MANKRPTTREGQKTPITRRHDAQVAADSNRRSGDYRSGFHHHVTLSTVPGDGWQMVRFRDWKIDREAAIDKEEVLDNLGEYLECVPVIAFACENGWMSELRGYQRPGEDLEAWDSRERWEPVIAWDDSAGWNEQPGPPCMISSGVASFDTGYLGLRKPSPLDPVDHLTDTELERYHQVVTMYLDYIDPVAIQSDMAVHYVEEHYEYTVIADYQSTVEAPPPDKRTFHKPEPHLRDDRTIWSLCGEQLIDLDAIGDWTVISEYKVATHGERCESCTAAGAIWNAGEPGHGH